MSNFDIRCGDAANLLFSKPRGYANHIIGDPLWAAWFLEGFGRFQRGLDYALQPDGNLILLLGEQSHTLVPPRLLPDFELYGPNFVFELPGSRQFLAKKNVTVTHQTAYWYRKRGAPPIKRHVKNRHFTLHGADKRYHPYGQPAELFYNIIQAVARPGELILDPFVGGGACGEAALAFGCRFMGFELESCHYQTTVARLRQFEERILIAQ